MPPPARHPPPCGSRSRLPRPCALAAVNELEQSTLATPLELELGERELETRECEPEPGEREPEPGEREPKQGGPSARADSNCDERRLDERAVLLIINKRSTLVRKREVSPHKNIKHRCSNGISQVYLDIIDSDVQQRLEPHPFNSNSLLDR